MKKLCVCVFFFFKTSVIFFFTLTFCIISNDTFLLGVLLFQGVIVISSTRIDQILLGVVPSVLASLLFRLQELFVPQELILIT